MQRRRKLPQSPTSAFAAAESVREGSGMPLAPPPRCSGHGGADCRSRPWKDPLLGTGLPLFRRGYRCERLRDVVDSFVRSDSRQVSGRCRQSFDDGGGWRQQLDHRHHTARVRVDGGNECELDYRIVAGVRTRRRQCVLSRVGQRRIVDPRGHHRRQQRAGARVAARAMPIRAHTSEPDAGHEWRRVNGQRHHRCRLRMDGDD